MSRDVVLGADVGTSGLKLVALGVDGAVVAEAESGYQPESPRPGWAQSEVGTWRRRLDVTMAEIATALAGARVRALGLSGQMHGAVLTDACGRPLGPALLWPDERAAGEVARWWALPAADRAALANPITAGMTGPFAAWLARHEPTLVESAAALLLPKDALRALLVPDADPRATDRSDASATLLWDVGADGWSAAAVRAAGIGEALLPAVRPATEVVGTALLPLGEVPVVIGAADTPLALLAAGGGEDQVNLGTGALVLRPGVRPEPADDPPVHTYADAADGWYAMAALRNGGSAWAWVCRVLGLSWAELFEAAESVPPGAGGVVFRPYLSGERSGVASGERGSFRGLQPSTTRADLARAAVEGVLIAVAAAAELLPGSVPDGPVLASGGGSRAAVVPQLLADLLGRRVRRVPLRSASAVGAALLAARAAGLEVVPAVATEPVVEPRPGSPMAAAAERWTGGAGVEPRLHGHR